MVIIRTDKETLHQEEIDLATALKNLDSYYQDYNWMASLLKRGVELQTFFAFYKKK